MIMVFPGAVTVGGAKQGAGAISLITQSDAAVVRAVPELEFVSEIVTSQQQVISSLTNWRTSIVGVNVDYQNIKNWPMKSGAFFTDADVTAVTKVCVLGSNVAETLFEDEDPTGQELRIRNHVFKVLGVMAPYTTVMKKLQGNDFLSYILASAKSAGDIAYSSQLITEAMRTAHNIESGTDDNFRVLTQDDLIAARTQATQTMTSLLAGIAAVSLLVGGIGIMNIMLVSVTERTREIGLRLAIGASGGDVLMQFLIEAVVISLAGGFIGIALGYGLSGFLNAYENMTTLVPSNAAFIAVAFSASVGIFFGFYPARKAAALDPIDALRFE
jgi:putative ABC transport system permease protein